ncbi:hypothetical protein BY996DRAFT_6424162 [Phakopsora pachyrhizi]|nr:hypothetical protein BY996DRAFT_6424162 [Phakopsora pachyrhizi]
MPPVQDFLTTEKSNSLSSKCSAGNNTTIPTKLPTTMQHIDLPGADCQKNLFKPEENRENSSLAISPAPMPISKNTTTSLAIAPAPIPISKSATTNSIMSSNSIIHNKNLQQSSSLQSGNLDAFPAVLNPSVELEQPNTTLGIGTQSERHFKSDNVQLSASTILTHNPWSTKKEFKPVPLTPLSEPCSKKSKFSTEYPTFHVNTTAIPSTIKLDTSKKSYKQSDYIVASNQNPWVDLEISQLSTPPLLGSQTEDSNSTLNNNFEDPSHGSSMFKDAFHNFTKQNNSAANKMLQKLDLLVEAVYSLKQTPNQTNSASIKAGSTARKCKSSWGGPLHSLIRLHCATLFGMSYNSENLPPPATILEKSSCRQTKDFGTEEDSDSAINEDSDILMNETYDSVPNFEHDLNFPYGNGPRHRKASPQTLAIIWQTMQKAGV